MNIIKNQKGMAVVTVLIIVGILSILGTTIWYYSSRDVLAAHRTEKKMQAYYLARSGVDAVAHYIVTNPDNIDMGAYVDSLINSSESEPTKLEENAPGSFKVKVTRNDGKGLLITGTGIVDNVREKAQLEINGGSGIPSLDMGLFAANNIIMEGSPKIVGDVVTNANTDNSIKFSESPDNKIEGNLSIGPGGDINKVVYIKGTELRLKDKVTGEVGQLDAVRTYELPEFPEFPSELPKRPNLEAGWWPPPPHDIKQDGEYSEIIVDNSLTINVGAEDRHIVVKRLKLGGDGEISLNKEHKDKGKLYLYIEKELVVPGSGRINKDGDSNDIIIYYKGDKPLSFDGNTRVGSSIFIKDADLTISGSGGITGHIITGGENVKISGAPSVHVRALYAPNAHISMDGSSKLKGAIISKTFKAIGKAIVEFDDSISNTFPGLIENIGGGTSYSRGLWR